MLTLFGPAYFDVSVTGGGHIVPRLNIFGLGRVRVPILFGNDLPRSDLPYTKGFMKFGCPEPSKKVFDFWNFCSSKRRLTRFVRVPPYEILVFPTNFIFFQGNEITLRGKKCTALFQTHNWEKSSFFNGLVRVFAQIYANTWQGGHNVPPPGVNRVKQWSSWRVHGNQMQKRYFNYWKKWLFWKVLMKLVGIYVL